MTPTMPMTQYIFEAGALSALTAEMQAQMRQNTGLSNFADFAAGVIAQNLAEKPLKYLEFGPYWWALKEVLAAFGHSFGDERMPEIAAIYRGADAAQTIVAADAFKDLYRATWAVGTADFLLDEMDGSEVFRLEDPDMMQRESRAG